MSQGPRNTNLVSQYIENHHPADSKAGTQSTETKLPEITIDNLLEQLHHLNKLIWYPAKDDEMSQHTGTIASYEKLFVHQLMLFSRNQENKDSHKELLTAIKNFMSVFLENGFLNHHQYNKLSFAFFGWYLRTGNPEGLHHHLLQFFKHGFNDKKDIELISNLQQIINDLLTNNLPRTDVLTLQACTEILDRCLQRMVENPSRFTNPKNTLLTDRETCFYNVDENLKPIKEGLAEKMYKKAFEAAQNLIKINARKPWLQRDIIGLFNISDEVYALYGLPLAELSQNVMAANPPPSYTPLTGVHYQASVQIAASNMPDIELPGTAAFAANGPSSNIPAVEAAEHTLKLS